MVQGCSRHVKLASQVGPAVDISHHLLAQIAHDEMGWPARPSSEVPQQIAQALHRMCRAGWREMLLESMPKTCSAQGMWHYVSMHMVDISCVSCCASLSSRWNTAALSMCLSISLCICQLFKQDDRLHARLTCTRCQASWLLPTEMQIYMLQ